MIRKFPLRSLTCLILLFAMLITTHLPINDQIFSLSKSFAEADWKAEFDDICSKTSDSMSLSDEELKTLIARAERLKPLIEKLDESSRKVYLGRLQKCRDLLDFVLLSRKKD